MLHREPTITYIVYPSWANLSYRWENLWPLLSDPLGSGHLDARHDWRRLGYPDVPQPFKLIDGPAGGGIVSVQAAPTEKCMAVVTLAREADIRKPVGYTPDDVESGGNVFYLEPRDGPLSGIPFAPPEFRRGARRYVCGVSAEHVGSGGGAVYWVVGFERGRKEIKGLANVPAWAGHFGMTATRLAAAPEPVRAETASWFVDPAYDYAWFAVESGDEGVGYHYAVVVYLAFHLRRVAGPRMFSMNLVAGIEGEPNARLRWHKR